LPTGATQSETSTGIGQTLSKTATNQSHQVPFAQDHHLTWQWSTTAWRSRVLYHYSRRLAVVF